MAITLSLTQPASEIRLDCEDLAIDGTSLDGEPIAWRTEPGALVLMPPAPLAPGQAVVTIRFQGRLHEAPHGLYLGAGFVATQLQPLYARRTFPCFDQPRFRCTFELSAWVPGGQTAISNGAIRHMQEGPDGRRRVSFAPSPPIPTYLLALAIGPFEPLGDENGVPRLALHALQAAGHGQAALHTARRTLDFFGGWLERPYAFDKLDLVVLPHTAVAGMENTAAIFLRESAVALPQRQAANLIAHEVAHQWFGGLVTPRDWHDLWLNEGFATWAAPKALAAIDPARVRDGDEVRAIREALLGDFGPGARALVTGGAGHGEVAELFDSVAYRKGAALLRMLEAWLGEAAFLRGLRLYLDRHANGTATSEDLWAALEEVSGQPVAAVGQPFATRAGAPHLAVCWDGATVEVTQPGDEPWRVPVQLRVALDDGEEQIVSLFVEGAIARVHLPATILWVCADAGGVGYYRSSYLGAWPPVAALSPVEAVVLIEDAWLALWNGEIDLMKYLALAGDAIAAGAALPSLRTQLDELRELLGSGGRAPLFDGWIAGLRCADADDDGWALLGEAGHPAIVAESRAIAVAALAAADAGAQRTEAGLAIATRHGDAALFDAMHAAIARGLDAERLAVAACAIRDPACLAGQLSLLEDTRLDASVRIRAVEALLANPSTRAACWTRIKQRWDDLGHQLIGLGGRGLIAGLGVFADAAAEADITQFFTGRKVPGAERMLHATLGRIAGRRQFRERHQAAMDAFLMRLGAPADAPSQRVRSEHALWAGMAAGFRGAFLQRHLFDRFGLPAPPWMHTAQNLGGAVAATERQLALVHRGAPVLRPGEVELAQRLRQDLLAAADQLTRSLAALAGSAGQEAFLTVVAGLARAAVMAERELEAGIVFAALFEPARAEDLRRPWARSMSDGASARAWIAEAPAGASDSMQRLALGNDAVLVPGLLRQQADRIQAHLAALGVAAAPAPGASWLAFGFDPGSAQAWRDAGFDDAPAAAHWRLRGFDPQAALRLADEGADPAALRTRPRPPSAGARSARVVLPDGTLFTVEVADDAPTRRQGLMHRDELPERGGMLFVYTDDRPRPITMRNVRIPLDVLWLDAQGAVLHLERAAPAWREAPIPQDPDRARCRLLLELPAGTTERHRVEAGARLAVAWSPVRTV